ncbi:hypothetical protein GCM10023322_60900 [Rugosimonospora acidiphila]|uniref:N-acetyltransferase domain-containing protein n=2 Tax=Rugosimonospora acidiphila TaxID=556531 RepID=A0ABP9SEU8_9ACTN
MEIHAGNMLIRPWQPADAGPVYQACQDPEIQRWTRVPRPYRPEHAADFVTEMSPKAWAGGSAAPLGVFDQATGELLGSCGLVSIRDGSGEVGYWTAPWARGRGVAVTALRAVALFAFESLGLRRVTWHAYLGNHASRLVALRAGVRVHGRTRVVDGPPPGAFGPANDHRAGDHPAGDHPAGDGPGRGQTAPAWRDAWWGTLVPGEVTGQTPPPYAPGSPAARRAALFAGPQPRLPGLAPLGEADVDALTSACQDPESARWTTIPVPYARADAEFFVRRHAPLVWAAGLGAAYQIVDGRGAYAGSVELTLDERDEASAEIGFLVAPWARGRGHATAAVRTICGWAFDALGLTRIVWRAHVGNEASRRVATKAGFTMEGVQRAGCAQRGERRDAWVGSLLATDPRPR